MTTTQPKEHRDNAASEIDNAVARVLALALASPPPSPPFGAPTRLTLGDEDLTTNAVGAELQGDVVVIRCTFDRAQDAIRAFRLGAEGFKKLVFQTSTGTFTADEAIIQTMNPGGGPPSADLHAYGARFLPEVTPRFWIGRPTPSLWRGIGNTRLEVQSPSGSRSSWGHLRLKGSYDYYLVKNRNEPAEPPEHFLVVDCGGPVVPDRRALINDFVALRFVLGRSLPLVDLVGVDAACSSAAWLSVGIRGRRNNSTRARPPVPVGDLAEPWTVALFESCSKALRDAPELRLDAALAYYVESLWEHMDAAYLKLQVAIEGTADRWLRRTGHHKIEALVDDFKEWAAWVDGLEDQFRKFARGARDAPARAELLKKRVKNQASTPSTSKVERAFENLGAPLTEELLNEVNGRNAIAHAALMTAKAPEERDPLEDFMRVAKIRSVLAMLVSLAVGYRGPLAGWNPAATDPLPDTVWKPRREIESSVYVARATIGR